DKELATRSLQEFIKQAWIILQPVTPFVPGWHIDALCEIWPYVMASKCWLGLNNVGNGLVGPSGGGFMPAMPRASACAIRAFAEPWSNRRGTGAIGEMFLCSP